MCYLFLTRLNVYVKSDAFTHMARYTVHSFNSSIRYDTLWPGIGIGLEKTGSVHL